MPTPSGQISLNDVNVELGLAGTTLISMNQSNVRTLAGVGGSGTPISMQNLQNKSNRVTASATISANTSNYTLNTAKASGYVAGKTDMTLTINSGVFVSSSSTGSYALTVDTSWTTGDTVTIVNNGTIIGRGGDGGNGGTITGGGGTLNPGSPGSNAGPALLVQRATSINNINRIAGGGGGGGGGGSTIVATGGGGGGGIGVSTGGATQFGFGGGQSAGGNGTLTAAGGGGSGASSSGSTDCGFFTSQGGSGGAGGTFGSSGNGGANGSNTQSGFYDRAGGGGGSAGAAVVGNSNITWIATGTRNGAIS
jgi:hypothetical protein